MNPMYFDTTVIQKTVEFIFQVKVSWSHNPLMKLLKYYYSEWKVAKFSLNVMKRVCSLFVLCSVLKDSNYTRSVLFVCLSAGIS